MALSKNEAGDEGDDENHAQHGVSSNRIMNATYVRVSTKDPNPDLLREEIVAWASHGIEGVTWYEDRISGDKSTRPRHDILRKDIFAGKVKIVILCKLDGLATIQTERGNTPGRLVRSHCGPCFRHSANRPLRGIWSGCHERDFEAGVLGFLLPYHQWPIPPLAVEMPSFRAKEPGSACCQFAADSGRTARVSAPLRPAMTRGRRSNRLIMCISDLLTRWVKRAFYHFLFVIF